MYSDESQAEIKMAGRNIKNFRYADDPTLMAEIKEELKSLLMKVKKESEKADLKFNNNKKRLEHLVPSLQGKRRKKWKQWETSFSWATKSLWMVTAAMKLKDACSLGKKL